MAFYKEIPMFFKEAAAPLFVGEEPRLRGGVVKTAQEEMPLDAEIAEFSATIRPDAGSTWVLLNAMGQGEFYGPNVNGDFFGYGELVRHPKEWESTRIFDVEKRRELARKFDGGYTTFYNAHPFKHHANKNPDRAFGTVEVAHWNKRMRRVELIIKLVHDQCLKHGGMDIVNRLKDGEFPDVSMGTRVIYDICSVCGNKAKNASEYCVHINERRREKDPKGDGTLPYMINIRPIFFDISFVLVGADRTARALWKIAQAQNAHLEDALYKIAYNKSAEIYKLSDLIKYVVPPMDGGRDSLQESDLPQNNRSEFPESILRGLGSLPMNEMFSTLGRSGAVLHPDEFKKIIIIRSGSPDMGSLMNLPMPSTSNIEVPADPSPCMPHGGMMQMLRSVLGGGMPNPMHTGKKIVRIIMGSPSLTATKGIAEGHPALQKISAAYNGYLLWSLADMRRMGGEW